MRKGDLMPMKNPPHPGGIVKDCLEDLGLSVTDAAGILDVTRPTLSRVINGRSALSPEMALRLALAFGSTPEMWLRLQTAYDLAEARQNVARLNVQRYVPTRGEGRGATLQWSGRPCHRAANKRARSWLRLIVLTKSQSTRNAPCTGCAGGVAFVAPSTVPSLLTFR